MHPQLNKPLYSVAEALAILMIGRTFFYQEVNANRIPLVKAGNRSLVPAQSIIDWIAALPARSGRAKGGK